MEKTGLKASKKLIALILSLMMLVTLIPVSVLAEEANEPKLVDGYYEVYTPEEWSYLANLVNTKTKTEFNIKLMDDIDLSKLDSYTPMGTMTSQSSYVAWTGTLEGNYHTVTIPATTPTPAYSGGFITCVKNATLQNFKVKCAGDITVVRTGFSPTVFVSFGKSQFKNIASYVNISGTGKGGGYVAGILAWSPQIVGNETTVEGCANFGNIDLKRFYHVGGIVGTSQKSTIIKDCLNTGNIFEDGASLGTTTTYGQGGIIGDVNQLSSTYIIENCYNTGMFDIKTDNDETVKKCCGSILGVSTSMTPSTMGNLQVSNCYTLPDKMLSKMGTLVLDNAYVTDETKNGVTSVTEDYLKSEAAVTALNNGTNPTRAFVFVDGQYPMLKWLVDPADTATMDSISVKQGPTKAVYDVHETLDTRGMVVVGNYSDGTKDTIHDYTYEPASDAVLDTSVKEIKVSYNGMTATTPITVAAYPLTDLTVKTAPTKTLYSEDGEAVDLTGLVLNATFEQDGKSATAAVDASQCKVEIDKVTKTTEAIPVSYTYNGVTKTVDVPINNMMSHPLSAIDYAYTTSSEGRPTKHIYEVGEDVDITGITGFTATFTKPAATEGEEDDSFTQKITDLSNVTYSPKTVDKDTKSITISLTMSGNTASIDFPIVIKTTEPVINEDGYYEITDAYQLEWFAEKVNAGETSINGKLMNDIDACNTYCTIGTSSKKYAGAFDGNEKTVTIKRVYNGTQYGGLFGYTDTGATIKNLIVNGTTEGARASSYAGGIVARATGTTFENCVSNLDINMTSANYVGGIAGYASTSTISNCVNTGDISTKGSYCGGIVGYGTSSPITKCINRGEIKNNGTYLGGLIGYNVQCDAKECANFGTVIKASASGYAGGLFGNAVGSSTSKAVTISNCYNAGDVDVSALDTVAVSVGSIAGAACAEITNCYNNGKIILADNEKLVSGAIVGTNDANLGKVKNCYYLAGTSKYLYNSADTADSYDITEVSSDTLKKAADALGEAYVEATTECGLAVNQGYPVFTWQTEHDLFSNPLETVEPTCTEDGYTAYKCRICGEEVPQDIVTAPGHDFDEATQVCKVCGETNKDYTGFVEFENGEIWYMEQGVITDEFCDIIEDDRAGHEGEWRYVVNSKNEIVDTVAENQYGWWRVKDGIVDFSYTGIAENEYGWWRIVDGKVDFDANGVYENEYGWWYVRDGAVDFSYTGIAQNEYGWWRIINGGVDFTAYGIFQNEYGWWYVKDGAVQFDYTGVQANEYGWWRIDSGKVNFDYNGIASNEWGTWYIKNGKVNFEYSGRITVGGKKYTVKDGKVVA